MIDISSARTPGMSVWSFGWLAVSEASSIDPSAASDRRLPQKWPAAATTADDDVYFSHFWNQTFLLGGGAANIETSSDFLLALSDALDLVWFTASSSVKFLQDVQLESCTAVNRGLNMTVVWSLIMSYAMLLLLKSRLEKWSRLIEFISKHRNTNN